MRTIKASSGKALFPILMVVVVIALAAGAGIYFQVIPMPVQPEPQPVVMHHKIAIPIGQTPSEPAAVLAKSAEPAAVTAMANEPVKASDIAAFSPDADPSSGNAGPAAGADRSPVVASLPDGPEMAVDQPTLAVAGPEVAATQHEGAGTAATALEDKAAETPAPAVLPLPPIASSPTAAGEQGAEIVAEGEKTTTPPVFYTVQVGAFRSKDNAQSKLVRMRQMGFEADIVVIMDAKQTPWYTVRFGHYDNRNQARSALAAYRQKENKPAVIIAPD